MAVTKNLRLKRHHISRYAHKELYQSDYNSLTINYYDENAKQFIASTKDVGFFEIQNAFLSEVQSTFSEVPATQIKILDFGCGSGRDSKYFLKKGFDVTATDGSSEMCSAASSYTGIKVRQMLFCELAEKTAYHGIWASASILHLQLDELFEVLLKIAEALKTRGVFYTSFKYGDFEGERGGRFFCDMTEEKFQIFLNDVNIALEKSSWCFSVLKIWESCDVRKGRENEKWLNIILQKN